MSLWTAIKEFLSGFTNDRKLGGRRVEPKDHTGDLEHRVTCVTCGSSNLKTNGIETKTPNPYQRYRCLDCGGALRGRLLNKGESENTYIREI